MLQTHPTIGPKKNVKRKQTPNMQAAANILTKLLLINRAADLTEIDIKNIAPQNGNWQTQPQIAYRPWQNGAYHVTMGLLNVPHARQHC